MNAIPTTRYHPLVVNILPEEYQPRRLNKRELMLLLVFMVGVVALVSQLPRTSTEINKTRTLDTQYRNFVSASAALAPSEEKAKKLKEEIANLQTKKDKADSLRKATPNLEIKWKELISAALVTPPSGIQPTSISKKEQGPLEIEGFSNGGFDAVRQYYDRLLAVPGVISVTITRTEIVDTKGQAPRISFKFEVAFTKE